MIAILSALHIASAAGLAFYGLFGYLTLIIFLRVRKDVTRFPSLSEPNLPIVTVQLPIFNEREVVQRLLNAVTELDYPADKLELQVLDDSTDDTSSLIREHAAICRMNGLNVQILHRCNRDGFKAGALQEALDCARGEYIAILDADFIPPPDFLRKTIPFFNAEPDLGVVQTRWGHLNAKDAGLTAAQAIALDKHFAVEQLVRHRADLFPKFNGSAGIWRKSCIHDAGGWQTDTACEDLCLSTRAVLAGWKFHFANDVVVPAELPSTILSYKVQQARWAMGATQCMMKYGKVILSAKQQSLSARLYAVLSMSAYLTHIMLLILILVQLPLLFSDVKLPSWLLVFSMFGLGQPILFALAQHELYDDWIARLSRLPTLLLIAIGLTPSNAFAVFKGIWNHEFTFERTPKGYHSSYKLEPGFMLVGELALLIYAIVTLSIALQKGLIGPVFLLTTVSAGLAYIIILSFQEMRSTS